MQEPCARGRAAPEKHGLPRAVEALAVADPTVSAAGGQPSMRAAELEPDPVVEAYKRHIDRTLLRQNLRRSVTERVANLMALQRFAVEARRAGRARKRDP